ncbi:hypothetical protein [Streptomyces phaeochromogenes]|uniref:hypothetical protein n=1 Tax=Streptomyces phaeochromogenes TaxID=1923 RepID=UPI003722C9D0
MAHGGDSRTRVLSDAKGAVSRTTIITGGGYPDTGLVIAHRREFVTPGRTAGSE